MSTYQDTNQCAMEAPAPAPYSQFIAQDIAYIQQQDHSGSKLVPPPLLTQNLSMYSMSDLQSVNAQQQMLTPVSASVPAPASASPSGSGSPFYGSFSDTHSSANMNSTSGSPYPPSSASPGASMKGVSSSLGLQGTGTGLSEPDTLLRLREEAERADRDEAKLEEDAQEQLDQDLDLDGNDSASALKDGLKPRGARRRIWTHALEKYLFTPHEIATLGAPHRRTIYLASLEAHIDRLHSQLLNIGLYPIDTNELLQYKGLNCKTAKGMVAGLQHDIASVRMRILEIERATRKTEETRARTGSSGTAGYDQHRHGDLQMSGSGQHYHQMHANTISHGDHPGPQQQNLFPTTRKFSLDSSMPPSNFSR